jgi:hypothetical protein
MELTLNNVTGLHLVHHNCSSYNYNTTLVITTEKGDIKIELYSKKEVPLILGEKNDD